MTFSKTYPAFPAAGTSFEKTCAALETGARPDSERLNDLFRAEWDYTIREYPEEATLAGYPGQNGRWTDLSPEAVARRKRELHAPLKTLLTINRDKLAAEERLSYDVFRRRYELAVEGSRFPSEYLQITQMEGVQQILVRVLDAMPKFSLTDLQDFVARLNAYGVLVDQTITLLEMGMAAGVTAPKITQGHVLNQINDLLAPQPDESPVLESLNDLPPSLPENETTRLRASALEALRTVVLPALSRLREFLSGRYIPCSRGTIAMRDLPDGAEWYDFTVRNMTTTRLTPREIHEIGLNEVKRINGEMERTIKDSGFRGSCEEFFKFLRNDPRFYYDTGEDLLAGYRDICKKADPELIRLFGMLPRQPYGVKPVPEYLAKSQPAAFYERGSFSAGRPGYFLVNLSEIRSRPKWEMETLALHEAVPGHHLQIALADEMENVPDFRRNSYYGAYIEGWALYAESLGCEMGFFRDVYSRFGHLTSEMWRAVRLVVDTGIHAFGWGRRQAIDYFYENASSSEHNAVVEVDRYIVLPAQALTYKIGQLKIRELRERAAQQLGGGFDLRAFHDELLRHGAIPLDIFEALVKEWVSVRKNMREK